MSVSEVALVALFPVAYLTESRTSRTCSRWSPYCLLSHTAY